MVDWDTKFRAWAKPPSDAEQSRCENTVRQIRAAVAGDTFLQRRNIQVFVQGSYRNNTNVRRDSDVDVGVLCYDTFFYDTPPNISDASFGIVPADYQYDTFKAELGRALSAHFEPGSVTRGNKAYDIKSSRSQVEADVAPFFEHRRYDTGGGYLSGVELRSDNGVPNRIINWPQQHYENGVTKNNRTGYRYKAMVRVFKSLRNEMSDNGYGSARPIIGFLNECLLWNVPDRHLTQDRYDVSVMESLRYLINSTQDDVYCASWGEVSDLKYLFGAHQAWNREQAHAYLVDAWNYVGF